MSERKPLAGEVLLRRLKAHGVDYLFANGGTDFAPVIEGIVEGQAHDADMPEALVIPHENAAIGMAHGYYAATGRPQAVMVHTNVGLANTVMGVINAAAEQIPMFVCSGRTPVMETGHLGCRVAPINWGQDMRDQNAMLREAVKWDFTMHYPDQMADLVDRAMSISMSEPRGPVYMSLPREALSARTDEADLAKPVPAPARVAPYPADVEAAAALLLNAKSPLIINHDSGTTPEEAQAMRRFAEAFALPVVDFWPARLAMSTESPMHVGFDVAEELKTADVILVIDALVPWIPEVHKLADGVKVIQAGQDPHHSRFPIRGYQADLALAGDGPTVIAALSEAMGKRARPAGLEARAKAAAARKATRKKTALEKAAKGDGTPMSNAWVSKCVSDILSREDGAIVSELGVEAPYMDFANAERYFGHPISGGLGWGLPMALGIQLADRERLVIAAIGDGSYMFANPVACHQIAEALNLPILTLVFNNGIWNAVKQSTLAIFPDGLAAKTNRMPVTSLDPAPAYTKVAEASRAYTERVETGADLPAALERALKAIREEKRQALLELRTVN